MGKLSVAAVLLLLYCAYNAQDCEVSILKMPLKHNSTFERVTFVNLTNPDAPRIMYDLRACLAHCDSIDCPAFSFHYISKLCSRATGFENKGPERLRLEDVEGVEDKYLGLFVKMPNMPVLEECYPSKDSFDEILKSYRNNTSPVPQTTPATSEAPGTNQRQFQAHDGRHNYRIYSSNKLGCVCSNYSHYRARKNLGVAKFNYCGHYYFESSRDDVSYFADYKQFCNVLYPSLDVQSFNNFYYFI